jgi:hypothetical protein
MFEGEEIQGDGFKKGMIAYIDNTETANILIDNQEIVVDTIVEDDTDQMLSQDEIQEKKRHN